MVVAITGANGFVGSHLAHYLEQKHQRINRITRLDTKDYTHTPVRVDWLGGVDTVIHTAAIAHSGHKLSDKEIAHIQHINIDIPVELATEAAKRKVRRFIFLSSAHVYGRSAAKTLDEDAELLPTNIYGACKMDAERQLVDLAESTGLELIILRPPLIYGPDVKANFLALLKLVNSSVPLPISSLKELRSYCFIDNLSDAIFHCLRNDSCWNDVYNIADQQPLSLADLCVRLARALNSHTLTFYQPRWVIKALLGLAGKRHMIETLCKPLVLDTRSIQQTLNWQPPYSADYGLKKTAEWYKEYRS